MAWSTFLQGRVLLSVAKYWSEVVPCVGYSSYILCSVTKQKHWHSLARTVQLSTNAASGDQQSPEGPKSKHEPKITLVGHDNIITITTLQDAQKISRRRDLKLVKMIDFDTKTQRAVYKLMTGAQFFEEDKRQRQLKADKKQSGGIKGEKLVSLSHRISEHDLQSRVKNILKWLAKNYEVRIVISGEAGSNASSEKICKLIENGVKENGRIVQKRVKGNDLKFQILPPKQSSNEHADNNSESEHVSTIL